MATSTGRRPPASRVRASSAATAVLPVRLPVPMTAIDGFVASHGRGGGPDVHRPAPLYFRYSLRQLRFQIDGVELGRLKHLVHEGPDLHADRHRLEQ